MAIIYGKQFKKNEILRRVGDMSQIAGIKRVEFKDGEEKGVEALLFKTGSGFEFTVLVDRAMDISSASYCGQSLCWRSSTGDVAPQFYEPSGIGFLRSFFGGLLVTCGLTYLGAPDVDEGEELGLHGRISHIPAENVSINRNWQGNNYLLSATGTLRQTRVFGENITLARTISTKCGESRIFIRDIVQNEGFQKTPLMILYHCNFGFPLMDKGTELISPSIEVLRREDKKGALQKSYSIFPEPIKNFSEEVYYHKMKADKDGFVTVKLVNKKSGRKEGFGIYLKYRQRELPKFVQWKMCGEGIYVMGLEPANCWVEGRSVEKQRGTLEYLKSGEKREYLLEIGVL